MADNIVVSGPLVGAAVVGLGDERDGSVAVVKIKVVGLKVGGLKSTLKL